MVFMVSEHTADLLIRIEKRIEWQGRKNVIYRVGPR